MRRGIVIYLVLAVVVFVVGILVETTADIIGIPDLTLYIPIGILVFIPLGRHYYRHAMNASSQAEGTPTTFPDYPTEKNANANGPPHAP